MAEFDTASARRIANVVHWAESSAGPTKHRARRARDDSSNDHFLVEQKTSTSILVHAGCWDRKAGNPRDEGFFFSSSFPGHIKMDIDGGGTSELFEDTMELDITETCYVALELWGYGESGEIGIDPQGFSPVLLASWPEYCTYGLYVVIAKVTFTRGVIRDIEQFFTGDVHDFFIQPDSLQSLKPEMSLNFTYDQMRLQLRGWDVDSGGRMNPGDWDHVLMRIGGESGILQYVTKAQLKTWLGI